MAEKPLIFLVDDEESLLEVTSIILEGEGFNTVTANSVKLAINILQKISPDIIVSDITMPEMTGYEFFQIVRSYPHLQNVPFVFMTAHSDIESIKRGKELGIDDYLTKPVDVNMLLSTIRGKLKRRQMLTDAFSVQMEQMKNQLFKMISHEMRTPLTAILGATEILSDTKENLTPTDFTTFLRMLQESSVRLNSMVEDFFFAMKIESNQILNELEAQSLNINAKLLIDRLVLDFERSLQKKNIHLVNTVPDETIQIIGYAPHLENILKRLLSNAVKFSHEGGKIIAALKMEEGEVIFSVQDFGIGISAEKQPLLFQKFNQVDRDKQEQQGSGLGLYIAHRLAQLNKCKLWFKSEIEKGSTFYFSIPRDISSVH
ncbi:MAG: hybrid sensor histidine kinase/response regulator [Bacteroidetes bacterium]|nr:hybrid sensor histidine kinase/response regulator [Bacteroidota bacterium]